MQKEATWEATRIDHSHYRYNCSNCGEISWYRKHLYCPRCGSQMVEKEDKK